MNAAPRATSRALFHRLLLSLLRPLHTTLRRRRRLLERLLAALILAGVLATLLQAHPVLPPYWDAVLLTAGVTAAVWSPGVTFWLFSLGALYALNSISLYLAVLVLCGLLLAGRFLGRYPGALALALAAPWLAFAHLLWSLPLLAGLGWGRKGGAWLAGLACAWGLLVGGVGGLPADWLMALGRLPSVEAALASYATANSLESLQRLVAPFISDPAQTLNALLQIALWAGAAALLGWLAERGTFQQRPLATVFAGVSGALSLMLVHLGLWHWLSAASPAPAQFLVTLLIGALASGFSVALLMLLRDFIEHPLPEPLPTHPLANQAAISALNAERLTRKVRPLRRTAPSPPAPETRPAPAPEKPADTPAAPAADQDGDGNDLIMLELD